MLFNFRYSVTKGDIAVSLRLRNGDFDYYIAGLYDNFLFSSKAKLSDACFIFLKVSEVIESWTETG